MKISVSVAGLVLLLDLMALSHGLAGGSRNQPLLEELRQRSAAEGLAIIQPSGKRMEIVPLGHDPERVQNPRGDSQAWVSGNGEYIAWNLRQNLSPANEVLTPIVVDSLNGTQEWQLPGCVASLSSLGVSADGRRVAFHGAYGPPGEVPQNSGGQSELERRSYYATIADLYYAESETKVVRHISGFQRYDANRRGQLANLVKGISWSPDNRAFTYTYKGSIYTYDVVASVQRTIASGSQPSWSPDGQWIAFKSTNDRAVAIRPGTLETKTLLAGRRIEGGVSWSPDSQYMLTCEKASRAWDLFHGYLFDSDRTIRNVIYRVADGARFAF